MHVVEIPLSSISVSESRQRKEVGNVEELAASIKTHGLLNPITVSKLPSGSFTLIAGERRLEAVKLLGWTEIPCHLKEELSSAQLQALELEENVKRVNLPWKDYCIAILNFHNHRRNSTRWNYTRTREFLCMTNHSHLLLNIKVAEALLQDDEKIHACQGISQARNAIQRRQDREMADALHDIDFTTTDTARANDTGIDGASKSGPHTTGSQFPASYPQNTPIDPTDPQNAPPPIPEKPASTLHANFLEWSKERQPQTFNFIHLDPPYGINHQKSDQGGSKRNEAYEDGEQVYWSIISSLIRNSRNFASPSCHIMLWLSMKFWDRTKELFEDQGYEVYPNPLIWFKSDNAGIVSRPDFWPRHVYETAMWITRDERKILNVVSDCYAAPAKKKEALHISEKPVPVLKHFFRMTVGPTTRMLDPCMGAGSSLRAAEALGAERVLGLDINPDFVSIAERELAPYRRSS